MMVNNENRYIIDVRRVHQEVSSGPSTSCKYCGLYDSKYHCGFVADLLLPDIYLELSNKGFFRSGKYFWKQNPYLSCCKEYAIRMNVQEFSINPEQKRIYQKFAQHMHNQQLPQKNNVQKADSDLVASLNGHSLSTSACSIKNINKDSQKNNEEDESNIKLLVQLIKNLNDSLFTEKNGFVNANSEFKIFKTKGKTSESDYYTNFLVLIQQQNKTVANSFEVFVEQYSPKILKFLSDSNSNFSYSINLKQKLLLFKSLIQNQQNHLDKPKDVAVHKVPKANGEQIHKEQHKKQQNVVKEDQKSEKQPKGKQKVQYVKDDGEIVFDEFSSRYIRIGDLEITLEDNQYDEEVYQIHCSYFQQVHQRDAQTSEKFANDKCIQIIEQEVISSEIDPSQKLYTGTFFFKYRLNGQLIAVSHVDILPQMFLSQYFFYKPEFKQSLKLGINSALIEIEYVKRMQKFFPKFLYFNFVQFIPKTTKMNYKADFQKQEILCPETYQWVYLTLDLKKQLYENPSDNPRLALKETPILPAHDFSDMNIEEYLYQNFMMYINQKYLLIEDLIPESQPQLLVNLACIMQAMGKTIFNSLTFGY